MKQKIRPIIFIQILLYATINVCAESSAATDFYNYNTISANVTDMYRYGEFQKSLFTGRMLQTIPLYTLEDPDFILSIALHYNAEGFKPRKHSGYVGYNWFLETGGCITREVNGYPDEIYGTIAVNNGNNYQHKIEGMYHFAIYHPELDKNEVFNLPLATDVQTCSFEGNEPNAGGHNVGNECDYDVDYLPDIFHYDFMGYHGSFMINNAGNVTIISGDFVDIDLSGILTDWEPVMVNPSAYNYPDPSLGSNDPGMTPYPKENSSITIKTNDGYTYIFGGDISALEYTIDAYSNYFFIDPQFKTGYFANPATVNTWHLSKIIAPNNRSVTYFYKPAIEGRRPGVPGGIDPLWEYNEIFNKFAKYNSILYDEYLQERNLPMSIININDIPNELICKLAFYRSLYGDKNYYLYSMTKTCVLDSIHISGTHPLRIIFDNSQETHKMYNNIDNNGNETFYKNCKHNYQLDSMRVFSDNKNIKSANLTYTYHSKTTSINSFYWRFLDTIHISGIGTYMMNYYNGSYPDLSNKNTIYSESQGESQWTDDYEYYTGYYSIALLQRITYPTGGYQTYEYEPYYYTKKRKYSMVADTIVEMNTVNENGSKHGARIKKVITYNKANLPIDTISYTYSDGIYNDNLRIYNLTYDDFNLYSEYGWPMRYKNNYGLLETHIGYGQVTEWVAKPQGESYKTIYKFDTGKNSSSSLNDSSICGNFFCDNNRIGVILGQMFYGGKFQKWGKLIAVENYDSNNILRSKSQYKYNNMSYGLDGIRICSDTIVTFCRHLSESINLYRPLNYTYISLGHIKVAEVARKLYIYPDMLTKEITKDYSNGDSLVTTHTYSYDRKLRVTQETFDDSRSLQHFTNYTYPDNYHFNLGMLPFSQWPGLYWLKLRHQIDKPIEIVSGFIGDNNQEYVTSGNINLYAVGKYISPRNSHLLSSPNIQLSGIGDSIYAFIPDSFIPPGLEIDYYPYLCQTMYLPLTVPIQDYQPMVTSGSNVVYDSYYKPCTEYKFNAMGRLLSIKPFGGIETKYTWNGIYPATKTIGNQTWTYTHIPHVGVHSITDPRGVTTYYDYDEHGRLIKDYQIVNDKEQILNVYQYHIKTE